MKLIFNCNKNFTIAFLALFIEQP